MTVPYTFGTATTSIPLSNLDANFNTPITLGNTSIYLGNTTTTIGNLTLTNVTISSGTANITSNITYTTANAVVFTNSSSIGTTGANLTFDGTTFTASSIKNSALTSGRVTYAGASGLLSDSANLTYGTGLSVNGISQVFQTGLFSTDGTLSNYSVNNGVYLNGNATGWSQLSGDGTRSSFVRVWGSGASPADFIVFNTASSERMRIDSSGKVLIGNSTAISTSPRLQVIRSDATVGATSYQLAWFSNATGYGNGIGIYAQDNVCGISADFSGASGGASALAFYTNATTTPLSPSERMRISSAGNVGIGTSSPGSKLTVASGGIGLSKTYSLLWGDTNSEIRVDDAPAWLAVNNTMTFKTYAGAFVFQNSADASSVMTVRVDTARVGIGTSSPTKALTVSTNTSTDGILITGSTNPRLQVIDTTNSVTLELISGDSQATIRTDTNHPLVFGTNGTERMQINAGAPILCLSGGSTTATGTGIAFPATQSASSDANTLDDYEEGTWTVNFYDAATAGNASATSTTAYYTKIGNLVTAKFRVDNISTAGMTGANVFYFSLPFSASASTNATVGSLIWENIAFTASYSFACSNIEPSAARGYFITSGSSNGYVTTTVSQLTSIAADCRVCISYNV